ncbi:MAG: YbaB/EbfC family nucleoid-associated protein [Patescibacteria group bacterium]|jgi:DNA-binding protein YbaB
MLDKAKDLYKLQKEARAVQKELKDTEIEATGADGEVMVVFNGEIHLVDINIGEGMLHPDKKRELETVLKKTISEAISRAQAVAAEKAKSLMGGFKFPGM